MTREEIEYFHSFLKTYYPEYKEKYYIEYINSEYRWIEEQSKRRILNPTQMSREEFEEEYGIFPQIGNHPKYKKGL